MLTVKKSIHAIAQKRLKFFEMSKSMIKVKMHDPWFTFRQKETHDQYVKMHDQYENNTKILLNNVPQYEKAKRKRWKVGEGRRVGMWK